MLRGLLTGTLIGMAVISVPGPVAFAAEAGAAAPYEELPDRAFGVHRLFRVYPAVRESSGAALTEDEAGGVFFWSLGDSGNGTALSRTDLESLKTERVELAERVGGVRVENVDWEALAPDGKGRLWILDGGGNNLERESLVAYEVDPREVKRPLPVLRRVKITYPREPVAVAEDGAPSGPDIEAGFIHAGSLFLIEKVLLGVTRVYQADLASLPAGAPNAEIPARRIGTSSPFAHMEGRQVPVAAVTDASLCSNRVYLLSYYGVFSLPVDEFTRASASPSTETQIGREGLLLRFSLISRSHAITQAEGLVAISDDQFLISREDGRVFCWRGGRFEEPAPRPSVTRVAPAGE